MRGTVTRLAAMPGRLRTTLLACALAATAAGCGSGDGTIPQDDSDNLLRTLDGIESSLESGDCELITQQVNDFVNQVNALPEEVDPEVEKGLTQGAAQLIELSEQPDQCEDVSGASGPTETEATSTTATDTETDTDTDTDTETDESTTSSTTTTTTDTETEEPPEDDVDQGGGQVEPPPGQGGGNPGGGRTGGATESGGLEGGKGTRG